MRTLEASWSVESLQLDVTAMTRHQEQCLGGKALSVDFIAATLFHDSFAE